MAYQDLREFIRALEKNNELKRIPFEVDPRLEITEFADRAVKQGGPALLFERPKGYAVPVLINAFASTRKMELALEVESVEEVARRIVEFLEMRMPEGLMGKLKMLPKLAEMGAFFPKVVSKGPCQEVVKRDDFSLFDFPVLQCWPEDGGRFITLPMVFSRNPDTGKRNCGMYRMQVFDERTCGMHWQTHKQGAEHYRRMQHQGRQRTDVAPPPMEDYYMGKAVERIFLPLMRLQLPEVRDIAMPPEGVFHNLILVKIRKSYPGHARKVMHSIWGTGQAMFSKVIVVVDEDVDVQNYREVLWKALNNIDPQRDIQFVMGPVDSLDHSSRLVNYGSKMGVDATRKWPGEGFTRPWPDLIEMTAEVKRRVDELWKTAGL